MLPVMLSALLASASWTSSAESSSTCAESLERLEEFMWREMRVKPEHRQIFETDATLAPQLRQARRIWAALDASPAETLRDHARTSIDPDYLRVLVPDLPAEDYPVLTSWLYGLRLAPRRTRAYRIDPVPRGYSELIQSRVHETLRQPRLRAGLIELLAHPLLPKIAKEFPAQLKALMLFDELDGERAKRLAGTLQHERKPLGVEGVYAQVHGLLGAVYTYLVREATSEQSLPVLEILKPTEVFVYRQPLFEKSAAFFARAPDAKEVLDYYIFGTDAALSAKYLKILILENCKRHILPWRNRASELSPRASPPEPRAEVAPATFNAKDFFAPKTGLRRSRPTLADEQSKRSRDVEAQNPTAAVARPQLIDQPVGELRTDELYEFQTTRHHGSATLKAEFGPNAIAWIRANPAEALSILKALQHGGVDTRGNTGLKKYGGGVAPRGGLPLQIKTRGIFRGKVLLHAGRYQILDVVPKMKLKRERHTFLPIHLDEPR